MIFFIAWSQESILRVAATKLRHTLPVLSDALRENTITPEDDIGLKAGSKESFLRTNLMKYMGNNKKKNTGIQALRGYAFLLIFFTHIGLVHQGSTGVSLFFVLSGFLLIKRYPENAPVSVLNSILFSWKHIKKLYLLHLLTTLLALPLLICAMPDNINGIIKRLLVNILLIQSWFPQENIRYSMNNVSWFLSVMAFLYTLFPTIRNYLSRKIASKRLLYYAFSIGCIQFLASWILHRLHIKGIIETEIVKGLTYNWPLFRTGDFLIGSILGKLYSVPSNKRHNNGMTLFGFAVFFSTCMLREVFRTAEYQWWTLTILAIPGSCFMVALFYSSESSVMRKLAGFSPILFIGQISGYAFLIHELVIRYSVYCYPGLNSSFINKVLFAGITLAITILLSEIWRAIISLSVKSSRGFS